MSFLTVEHLTRIYQDGTSTTTALDDISLTIDEGEFIAVIGSSGSGKSTLMHLLGGVDRPTSGTVRLQGQNIYDQTDEQLAIFRRREVGLIYQFYNLIPMLDVTENILLPIRFDGKPVPADKLESLLRTLGLSDQARKLPRQLSGGQQQRCAIARALISTPALILADEPTGSLDSKNSLSVMQLLISSCREHRQTLIVITHDEEIALMADRVIAIEDGKIASDVRRNGS